MRAGQHAGPVRAPVGLVQHNNALDGSIMNCCRQPECWDHGKSRLASSSSSRQGCDALFLASLQGQSPTLPANSKHITLQTWPVLP